VVVRDRNAHAWVELWMPSQGWVRFDPTPRSDGANPATASDLPFDLTPYLEQLRETTPPVVPPVPTSIPGGPPVTTVPGVSAGTGGGGRAGWVLLIAAGAILAGAAVPAVKLGRRRRRRQQIADGDITAAWDEIVDRLTDLGDGPTWSSTPFEYAAAQRSLEPLVETYAGVVYGPETAAPDGAGVAGAWTAATEIMWNQYSPARRAAAWWRMDSFSGRRRLRTDR
jgi:hypothetical protein